MRDFFNKLITKTASAFHADLEKAMLEEQMMFVVTANPETFMTGEREAGFRQLLLDKHTTIVPDGIGIVKVANMLEYSVEERIPGVEIAEALLKQADKHKKSVFLFGAKPEVIEGMKQVIKTTYPGIVLAGAIDGYISDKDAAFQTIADSKPDVVLVAMGIPVQEKLIYKHLDKFHKGIFVGVGGSFDVLSGMKKRSPEIFIKLNIEWLYRMMKEPSRIKRFYVNNVKFIKEANKLKKRGN